MGLGLYINPKSALTGEKEEEGELAASGNPHLGDFAAPGTTTRLTIQPTQPTIHPKSEIMLRATGGGRPISYFMEQGYVWWVYIVGPRRVSAASPEVR